jgi:hypothetical protein
MTPAALVADPQIKSFLAVNNLIALFSCASMIEVHDFRVHPSMLFSQVFDLSAEIPPQSAVLDPGNG